MAAKNKTCVWPAALPQETGESARRSCTRTACGQKRSQTKWSQRDVPYICKNGFTEIQSSVGLSSGGLTLSLAHWMVCSMTEGKDFSVQNGISSSGGSLFKKKKQKNTFMSKTNGWYRKQTKKRHGSSHGCCRTLSYLAQWFLCVL